MLLDWQGQHRLAQLAVAVAFLLTAKRIVGATAGPTPDAYTPSLLGDVADRLDVVAVRVPYERAVVLLVILGPEACS